MGIWDQTVLTLMSAKLMPTLVTAVFVTINLVHLHVTALAQVTKDIFVKLTLMNA